MSEHYIPGGFILISRKLIESEIWEMPPLYLKVWMYILTKARHRTEKNYQRGELLISIPEIQEACSHKVGYRVEKPTKTQIFNILEWLRRNDEGTHEGGYERNDEDDTNGPMITTTKTTRGLSVKVHKYNVYQDPKNYERNDERNDESNTNGTTGGTTNRTMTERQADTIHKNVKNYKELKNDKNDKNNYNENRENNLYSAADLEEKTVSRRQVNQNLDNPDLKSVIEKYEQHGFGLPSGHTFYVLDESIKRFGKELTEYALKVADESGKRNIKYFGGILKNWEREGLKSKAEVIANENKRDRDSQATYKSNMRDRQGESRPKWLDETESNTEKPEVEENPIDDAEFNKLLSFFKDREMTYEN